MCLAQYLLALACCALWPSCWGERFTDAFAAVQESLTMRRLNSLEALGNGAPEEPVTRTEVASPWMDIERAIQESLADEEKRAAAEGRPEVVPKSSAENSVLSISYRLVEAEPNTTATFNGTSCTPTHETCQIDLNVPESSVEVDVELAKALDEGDQMRLELGIHVLIIHKTIVADCAACGTDCVMAVMGKSVTFKAAPCPIPAGKWAIEFPASMLRAAGLSNTILSGTIYLNTKITRKDGNTAVSYGTTTKF